MKKIIILILSLTTISCSIENTNRNELVPNSKLDVEQYLEISLIDTFKGQLRKDTSSSIKIAEFHPLYIGEKKRDSVFLNYKPSEIECRGYSNSYIWVRKSEFIQIYIDTTRQIGMPMDLWEYYDAPQYRRNILSYPVFIENTGTDTIGIGYGDVIPILTEAKDEEGNWRKIDKLFLYYCGTGLSTFNLAPDNIMITSCKLFKGDFKTQFRLALESKPKVYSNTFNGYLNQKQFLKGEE